MAAFRPVVKCKRCDSSGSIEGPEAGWYELECPDCKGTGLATTNGPRCNCIDSPECIDMGDCPVHGKQAR